MSPKARPEAVIDVNLAEQTRAVLQTLTPREEAILRQRFGIAEPAEGESSLEEIGQDFETTRERIREIEAKALAKLAARKTPYADDDEENEEDDE